MARWERLRVALTGTTGSGRLDTQGGVLCGIRISGDGAPGTVDITLREVLPDGAAPVTLLTLTNVTVPYYGVLQTQSVNNVGSSTGSYVYPVFGGSIIADIAQGNAGNVDIWLLIE